MSEQPPFLTGTKLVSTHRHKHRHPPVQYVVHATNGSMEGEGGYTVIMQTNGAGQGGYRWIKHSVVTSFFEPFDPEVHV